MYYTKTVGSDGNTVVAVTVYSFQPTTLRPNEQPCSAADRTAFLTAANLLPPTVSP